MSILKKRLLFNVKYFLFWIAYFVFARLFFLLFHLKKTQELDIFTILKTFLYGSKLDSSFSAYLCIIPFLLMIISIFITPEKIGKIIKWYTIPILIFITLMMMIDAGLYNSWGIRLDTSLLPYLNTPQLMIATVSWFQLVSGIFFWFLISFIFIKFFNWLFIRKIHQLTTGHWLEALLFLIITSFLIIPIRGGFQIIPVNQSNVYFSKNMYANHVAINYIWNFFNVLSHKSDGSNPYKVFDTKMAKKTISKTRNQLLEAKTDSILNTSKPNVILIIWESLTGKLVGSIGGEPNVTENLNQLSEEGILFTNFYANGDRTDKAIPAILSGYIPQPVKKIMRMPNKTRSLPMLPKKMMDLGYKASFYYGGDLNFGNMNTYIRNSGITNIVDGSEFDKKDWNSKWGAYDDVFMKRFANDISKEKEKEKPFFKIALTLTSHEPYEIRGSYKFGKDSEENLLRSSQAYTDNIIGEFIDFAKKQDWYKNTLIVIMADHGHNLPEDGSEEENGYFSLKRFKIPMLWLGGAIKQKGIKINTITSQVDFSYTLLDILKGDNTDFTFGKNLFNSSEEQYAHYVFNKGFGTVDKNGFVLYDYVSKEPIISRGKNAKKLDSLGKAITQYSYSDFLSRQ